MLRQAIERTMILPTLKKSVGSTVTQAAHLKAITLLPCGSCNSCKTCNKQKCRY